ncbi:hypothetical protein D3C79_585270 [compost metagenome]
MVEHPAIRCQALDTLEQPGCRRLAAEDQATLGNDRLVVLAQQRGKMRRHHFQGIDALLLQVLAKAVAIECQVTVDQVQGPPLAQGPEHHGMAEVGCQGRDQGQPLHVSQRQARFQALQVMQQRPMTDHHPFGLASGAGGVNHIGQCLKLAPALRVVLRRGIGLRIIKGQGRQLRARRQRLQRAGAPEYQATATGLDHLLQAPWCQLGIERHIGRPTLERCQQRDQRFQRALGKYRDLVLRTDSQGNHAVRQLVGAGVERGVAQLSFALHQRQALGMQPGLLLDLPVHTALQRQRLGWRRTGQ